MFDFVRQIPVDCIFSKFAKGDYNEQVQRAASDAAIAGNLPYLLDFDGLFVYSYLWGGFLIPLYEYLTQEMKADFLPTIIVQHISRWQAV